MHLAYQLSTRLRLGLCAGKAHIHTRRYRSDLKDRDHPATWLQPPSSGRRFLASKKQQQQPAEAHTRKKQGTNKKKVPSEKKKAKTLSSPCLHRTFDAIDNPAENPSHFSRSPIIQLTGKSTMPSSQPLYRTLHPINITKTSSMRSMGKWESIEIGRLRAFVVFLSNLPSSIFRQETDRRTPHCTNDVSP